MDTIRFVVVDDPWANWENPAVQSWFNQLIDLRKRSFASRFSANYAPVDTCDFHATHLLAYRQGDNGHHQLLTAVRLIQLSRCAYYNMALPCLGLLREADADHHLLALNDFIASHAHEDIVYGGAFAIEPTLEKAARMQAIELLAALLGNACSTWNIQSSVSISAVKTGADKIYAAVGLQPLSYQEQSLPAVAIPRFDNELFEVQTGYGVSVACQASAIKYQKEWNERTHYAAENLTPAN